MKKQHEKWNKKAAKVAGKDAAAEHKSNDVLSQQICLLQECIAKYSTMIQKVEKLNELENENSKGVSALDIDLDKLTREKHKLENDINRANLNDAPVLEKLIKEVEDMKKVCVGITLLKDQVTEKETVLKCRNV